MIIKLNGKHLELPESAQDVKLGAALSFLETHNKFTALLNEHGIVNVDGIEASLTRDELGVKEIDGDLSFRVQYLGILVEALSNYFDIPAEAIYTGKFQIDGADLDGVIEQLSYLFGCIAGVISKYEPKVREWSNCEFTHKGERYIIPAFLGYAYAGRTFKGLTVGQGIECLEVKRILATMNAEWKDSKFTELISTVSIIARKITMDTLEEFPNSLTEITAFINARRIEFEDINMIVGFDIGFFLLNFMRS